MLYESLTIWQAEQYVIEVCVGIFTTRDEAESFGNQGLSLTREGDRLVISDKYGNFLDEAFDENVSVFRLKVGSQNKPTVSHDDYEKVNIDIERFGDHSELSSFGSLAYGTREIHSIQVNFR